MKKIVLIVFGLLGLVIVYLLAWPVPIEPQAWQAPSNPGYTGVFAPNQQLHTIEQLPLGDQYGPEEVIVDEQGELYAATHDGWIVRMAADGSAVQNWVQTDGRPLGLAFDPQGNLIVADAFRGLLQITPAGAVTELATEADGIPIRYANNVDVAADGKIYFSDSSTRFAAQASGGTYAASLLDIMEHSGTGRLLVYDPATQHASTVLDGLNFANGVAVSSDQSSVLVNETGEYRVLRYWRTGPKTGQVEPVLEALPGFPDNLTRGQDGRYWLALISPRNALLDRLADKPWLRKVVQRLPAALRPKAVHYGHVVAFNESGEVVLNLQDPAGTYPLISAATETDDALYFGSLTAPAVGKLNKDAAGLTNLKTGSE
ncbi:MAG: SMP-30/gluconolactonase/LRE family protein [Candidatus Competibacteraceae bacterium]|nr:SMP-30/gluconolactonase/LRE family protein [Candidatus Competibacteraceae bacterium]